MTQTMKLINLGQYVCGAVSFGPLAEVDGRVVEQLMISPALARALETQNTPEAKSVRRWMHQPLTRVIVGWAAEWVRSNCPEIAMSADLAASLMATTMTPNLAREIQLPWSSFLVRLPSGLLMGIDPRTGRQALSMDLVLIWLVPNGDVGLRVLGENGAVWAQPPMKLEEFGEPEVISDKWWYVTSTPLDSVDRRAMHLVRRLVLSACAEMSNPEFIQKAPQPTIGGTRKAAEFAHGTVRFRLNREVRVSCRDAVRNYVAHGAGTAPVVRSLVRGHWKRQAYGAELLDRKLIWIQPYWRGPEDGPPAIRPHRLVLTPKE